MKWYRIRKESEEKDSDAFGVGSVWCVQDIQMESAINPDHIFSGSGLLTFGTG